MATYRRSSMNVSVSSGVFERREDHAEAQMRQPARKPLLPAGAPPPGRTADNDCRVRRQHLQDHVVVVTAGAKVYLHLRVKLVQKIAISLGRERRCLGRSVERQRA